MCIAVLSFRHRYNNQDGLPFIWAARVDTLSEPQIQVQEGDILVVDTTGPAWTPLFEKIHGLVMVRGGSLSHGAPSSSMPLRTMLVSSSLQLYLHLTHRDKIGRMNVCLM